MDKVLSQDEINALFSAMSSENLSLDNLSQKPLEARKIAKYDFHRADHISQDQMKSVHLLHEYFSRNFSSSLSAYLRAFVEVNLISVEQLSYAAFIKALPELTLFISIGMRPLDGNLAMELNPSLVFPIIDMLLGGPGSVQVVDRSLTEIELNIIEGVIKLAMRDLREVWRPIMEFDFYLEGKGTKAQMGQIISPAETVITISLEIKVGDNSGLMNLCIPSRVLKMLRNRFDLQRNFRRQKAEGSEAERIFKLVRSAPMSLSGEIQDSRLSVHDLLKISEGDIIELSKRVGDAVFLCVGGIPKFRGQIVMRRGKKAFEIFDKYVS